VAEPTAAIAAPEDIRALAEFLAKPEIPTWLKANASSFALMVARPEPASASQILGSYLSVARSSLRPLVTAIPNLPAQLTIVRATLASELRTYGAPMVFGPLVWFHVLGTVARLIAARGFDLVRVGGINQKLSTSRVRDRPALDNLATDVISSWTNGRSILCCNGH
jgi:hypothetical protein